MRSASIAASTTGDAARESGEEYRWVATGMRALRQHPVRLPQVALTLITGLRHGRIDARQRAQVNAAHRLSVAQHPAGRLVEATGSDHLIPFTEPQLIADEALRMLRG